MIQTIKPEEFEDAVVNSSGDVLVYFTASFCGPCKSQFPIVQKFSDDNSVITFKVELDGGKDLANKYDIRNVPTMALFRDGKYVASKVGLTPEGKIKELMEFK